jgi:tetratricopeptide (TPR) repeat protein
MVTVKERTYWDIVTRYARGNRSEAIAGIAGWDEKDLGRILKSIQDLEKAARRCDPCEDRARFNALPLRAAILLHAERDRLDRLSKVQENGGAAECVVSPNGRMSAELLGPAVLQPDGARFAARFAAAFALHLRSALCFLTGRNWAEAGLKLVPRDAALRFADGLASETIGVTGFVEPNLRQVLDVRGRRVSGYEDVNRKKELNRAVEDFEQALALDEQFFEARLRLGRVLWRLGRGREAREALERAVMETSGAMRYLAHLFLGQCLEDDGDLPGAIDHYSAAVALRPDTQIGAVALAHAQSLRGRSERAREIVEGALSQSGRRRTVDPYWNYLMGVPETAEALIEDLRRETLR